MTDDYATYDDVMEDLANDRDDSLDPEYRDPGGYCPHGQYVGGCGADLMCEWCEDGISASEARAIVAGERARAVRERSERQAEMIARLRMHGMPEADIQTLVDFDNRTNGRV